MAGEVVPTTQTIVLNAVIAMIQAGVTELREITLATSVDQALEVEADTFIWGRVVPVGGEYDDAAFTGGGENVLFELTGFHLVIAATRSSDPVGRKIAEMTQTALGPEWGVAQTRSMLSIKHEVLKTLTGKQLLNGSGQSILINLMQPMRCDPVVTVPDERSLDYMILTFTTDFNWDLT